MSFLILMKWLYRLPQKKKFSGVMIGDMAVVVAVNETDRAMLPFESAERKFEMFPPGHDAMRIIPSAIIGVMTGLNAMAMANVTAGRKNHCRHIPTMMDLGL